MTNWIIFNEHRIRKESITSYGMQGTIIYVDTGRTTYNTSFDSEEKLKEGLRRLDKELGLND